MFAESGQPICGNGMLEPGEECDCGYSDQCKDPCCYSANEAEDKRCKLQPGKICRSVMTQYDFNMPLMCSSIYCCQSGLLVNLSQPWSLICDAAAPAKGHVAQKRVHLRATLNDAGANQTVPKRACAMEPLLCVPPLSQRKTSLPAILIHKFASAGYVRIFVLLLFYFPDCPVYEYNALLCSSF